VVQELKDVISKPWDYLYGRRFVSAANKHETQHTMQDC